MHDESVHELNIHSFIATDSPWSTSRLDSRTHRSLIFKTKAFGAQDQKNNGHEKNEKRNELLLSL